MADSTEEVSPSPPDQEQAQSTVRVVGGGILVGLANLVPGVSGGTMILALGLYQRFIHVLAGISRFQFRRNDVLFLARLVFGASLAVLTLSGPAVMLVTEYRWVMYSLFIGMTLGGTPTILPQVLPLRPTVLLSIGCGIGLMAVMAWGGAQMQLGESTVGLAVVGALAASSMILPGVSGSYILLILGMYDLVIGSVSPRAIADDPGGSLGVLLPVMLGAVVGIGVLSNALRVLLKRFSAPVHGTLLGLLVGSILGLWPFQEPTYPEIVPRESRRALSLLSAGTTLEEVNAQYSVSWSESDAEVLLKEWGDHSPADLKSKAGELSRFDPSLKKIIYAAGLFLVGFLLTQRLGRHGSAVHGEEA